MVRFKAFVEMAAGDIPFLLSKVIYIRGDKFSSANSGIGVSNESVADFSLSI